MTWLTNLVFVATNYTSCWSSGPSIDCVTSPFFDLLGSMVVTTILGSFYSLSLWWSTGSMYPVAVILTLFVGLFIFGAPAPVAVIGGLVVTITLAMAYHTIFTGRIR
jgi:hypothetical protein